MRNHNKVSVIIVTFNNAKTILDCLTSISDGVEIIVVDNNSSDATVSILLKNYDQKIKLIQNSSNLGFGKAVNIGASEATGEYLCFLNPDAKFKSKNGLLDLVEVLEGHPEYGLIGPKLLFLNGETRKTARNLPTLTRAFEEYILGIDNSYDFYTPVKKGLTEVESVVGACMLLRKSLFDKIGGFDERFFMYYEDIDLCRKIRLKGLKVGYFKELEVEHIEGVSGRNVKTYDLLKDSAKEYHGIIEYYLLQLVFLATRILRIK